MNAAFPKVRTVKILLAFIPEEVLDVLTNEGRRVIAGRFETVDHRRRAGQQVLDASTCRRYFRFRLFPLADVAPRANDLHRLALFIAYKSLLIVDPAVASVLPEKTIFDRVRALLEQVDGLSFYRGQIIGMHAAAPEIRIFQVFAGFVTQSLLDVLADECRREIPGRLVAIDHGRCRRQQTADAVLRKDQGFADLFA